MAKYFDSPKGLVCMPTEDVETFGEDVAGLISIFGRIYKFRVVEK